MASGHIRKRNYKSGPSWQITIEKDIDSQGDRQRIYKTIKGGTKKDAQKVMNEMLNKMNKGTYLEKVKTTVKMYFEEWMETYVVPILSPTTVVSYKANVYGHIIPKLGEMELQKLTATDIQKFYNKLATEKNPRTKKPLSYRTIDHIHANISSALKQAIRLGLIDKNPIDAVIKPKPENYKADVYNEAEVKQLLKRTEGHKLEMQVVLGVGLGLRRGEILGLRWSAINFEEATMKIDTSLAYVEGSVLFKKPKSSAGERTLLVPASIIELLKRHKKKQNENKLLLGAGYSKEDLVCCNEDGSPIIPGTFSHQFARLLENINMKKIRFHDLRHTHECRSLGCF